MQHPDLHPGKPAPSSALPVSHATSAPRARAIGPIRVARRGPRAWVALAAWAALSSAALVLSSGCASRSSDRVPQVEKTSGPQGSTELAVAPHALACDTGLCPALGAQWSSSKNGQAGLIVGFAHQTQAIQGVDLHFGASEVVRLRLISSQPAPALGYPASRFDVPLRVISQLAYTPSSWVRIYLADGRYVDETMHSGVAIAPAVGAMAYFMQAVQQAGGTGVQLRQGGGLLDKLGGGADSGEGARGP